MRSKAPRRHRIAGIVTPRNSPLHRVNNPDLLLHPSPPLHVCLSVIVFPDDEAEMKVGVKLSLWGPGRQLSAGPDFEHHH